MCAERKGKVMKKVLKIFGITLASVVVLLGILLFCAVKFLNSKDFAPTLERMADDYIDGRVKLGSLKLGFHPRFPILGIELKDLRIVSNALDSLTAEERGLLPNYADSLLSLDYLTGSLDVKKLWMDKELDLHDVVMRGLSVNVVIAHNGKANYEILKSLPESDTPTAEEETKKKLPSFRINRFALEEPKEIRFYNAADSTSASVLLLTDAAVDGNSQPTYRLRINGNVTSPKATLLTNLDQINFGLNGKVYWDPASPGLVAVDEMELRGAFIKAIVTGEVDFSKDPIISKLSADLPPVPLTDMLSLLPDSLRDEHRLREPYFTTDLKVGGSLKLTAPMNLTTDTLPASIIKLYVLPAAINYGKAHLKDVEVDVEVSTLTNCPDSTMVNVNRIVLAGRATRLEVSGRLSQLTTDPSFDAIVKGDMDLADLPPIVTEKIPGYLSGIISADLKANGKVSMFRQEHLHRLMADGSVTARKIYFLTADTNNLVQVNSAKIAFGGDRLDGDMPLLNTKIEIDTANLLLGGVDLDLGSISLTAGVVDDGHLNDTTRLVPIGGDLKVKRFNIVSITDSAGARIRDVGGHVTLRRNKSVNSGLELLADLITGHVSAGTLSDRILLDDTKIHASLNKLPSSNKGKKSEKRTRGKREYSYIAPAAVFRHAYLKRHHKPGQPHKRRVYGTIGSDDNEILKWDLAKGFSKFLNEWRLAGNVANHKARLLTPFFPLRNHFSLIDLRFNNDTVGINKISLTVEKSDITLSGVVSNVKRALTAKTNDTLKANLLLKSDTIDINQISAGIFTGASYADRRRKGEIKEVTALSDKDLASRLDKLAKKGPGKSSPVLIPVNIDANLRIEADKVLYSDLVMQNLGGDLLVYDGGVNLHDMRAASDAGSLTLSALYTAPKTDDMQFGFGLDLKDFNIAKFIKLVPAIDSIMPMIHDFSGVIGADIAATCRIDSGMNLDLPTLNAAIRINGDNLAFINPKTYRTIGKWLGFKNKTDNTIHRMNVEMTVADGLMRVYPFAFNIDRYRLGVSGYNDIDLNFDYHISVLKSPIPFKFGVTISGNPKKYKVRFGGAKFKEDTAVESVSIVNEARINLIDQIESVFSRGVRNSRFAHLQLPKGGLEDNAPEPVLSAADSLQLIKEGLIEAPAADKDTVPEHKPKKKRKKFLFF